MPCLYSLTLQKPTAVCHAIAGYFSAPRTQEVLVSRGTILELLRADEQTGKLRSVCSTEVFGFIRAISSFRQTAAQKEYIVLGSDSGRITIVEFNPDINAFVKIHQETYGKTGIRRIVPGQYLATDPKGRAVMIGAVEKCKFVYVLNRDASNNLTISSPLEAHKSNNICFALAAADNAYDNPTFISIEQNYESADKPAKPKALAAKVATEYTGLSDIAASKPAEEAAFVPPPKGLAWWEMDLGLNHVIKKCTLAVDNSAHLVIPLPAGSSSREGPSGVLVCCENFLAYKKPEFDDIVCALPRRLEMGQDKKMMVVASAIHRLRDFFFILLQTEYGDLYKVELNHRNGQVAEIVCRYFDTVPVSTALCVLRSGHLFAASEFGNHQIYQFTGIGTDRNDPVCTSMHPHGAASIVAFKPRPLKNLLLVDELPSLAPITDMKVIDALSEGIPQIYTLCGRGPRSQLRILQHGISVEEMADNELPGRPRAVWTMKETQASDYDRYIIVSFATSTLILAIGETVEEISDSAFLTDVSTVHVDLLFDNTSLQVYEGGYRHLRARGVVEWKVPAGRRVVAADSNTRQLCIALNGGLLLCFEMDESHTLVEAGRTELGHEITCLSVQPVPTGRTRGNFAAVGGLDNTVRVLSLERDRDLRQLSVQALPGNAHPESCAIIAVPGIGLKNPTTCIYLNIGLETGILIRVVVDPLTAQLSDQRSRFIGARAVRLNRVTTSGAGGVKTPALMALSVKPWLIYSFQGKLLSTPLHYDQLEYVSSFSSEQCPDGFAATAGRSLRIFQCSRLGETFSSTSVPLTYTPRRLTSLPPPISEHQLFSGLVPPQVARQCMLAIVESDHNAYDEATKNEIKAALKRIRLNDEEKDESENAEMKREEGMGDAESELPEEQVGTFKAGPGKWGSCVRVIDPHRGQTIQKLHLDIDEAALCICVARFIEYELPCLVVGTVFNMTLHPKKVPLASIKVYAYDVNYNLSLLHSTPVEDAPMALCPWNGRLLASVGNRIRIYALGRKKLLKKCEYRNLPEGINWLRVIGDRIFAADIREGIHVLKYREKENLLHVLADDITPCWTTTAEILDYHSAIIADKFDGIRVCRVPSEAKEDEKADLTGLKLKGDTAYLTGQTHKLVHKNHYHVGDVIMALQKATLTPGGSEAIVFATLLGGIGVFLPLQSKEEVDFLQHLEMAMRTEHPPLCGRNHSAYRSYYFPVQGVIDGDLCEQFMTLPSEKQRDVAKEIDKTPAAIMKKLEEFRNRVL